MKRNVFVGVSLVLMLLIPLAASAAFFYYIPPASSSTPSGSNPGFSTEPAAPAQSTPVQPPGPSGGGSSGQQSPTATASNQGGNTFQGNVQSGSSTPGLVGGSQASGPFGQSASLYSTTSSAGPSVQASSSNTLCDPATNPACAVSQLEGIDKDKDGVCVGATNQDWLEANGQPVICTKGWGDCNDNDASVGQGPAETCNGADDDCDGQIDEGSTLCPGANSACVSGSCGCAPNYGNCDSSSTNGCEVNLLTGTGGYFPNHCGSCGKSCSAPNAYSKCASGVCQIDFCNENSYNLNGVYQDGCEYSCFKTSDVEICNDKDDNCDGQIDEGCDDDADDYCDAAHSVDYDQDLGLLVCPKTRAASTATSGIGKGDDCNDALTTGVLQSPAQLENDLISCTDKVDNDCDGLVDEQDKGCETLYVCKSNAFDPATRVCTGGQWCVGHFQEGYPDCEYQTQDADVGVHDFFAFICTASGCTLYHSGSFEILQNNCVPGQGTEICGDGLDNDCDGQADEGCPAGCSGTSASQCTGGGLKPDGQPCQTNGECASTYCVQGRCSSGPGTVPPCTGTCSPPGTGCTSNTQCQSSNCVSGTCAAPTCTDGVFNGDETDIDCGGSCSPCADTKKCLKSGDCSSGVCQNYYCGGTCVQNCPTGLPCAGGAGCASGSCNTATNTCNPPGPPGSKGNKGDPCQDGSDCNSGICKNGFCDTDDGTQGGNPVGCTSGSCSPPGAQCTKATDCNSKVCTNGKCVAPTCSDGVYNDNEAALDCGKVCGPSGLCPNGQTCNEAGDCSSGSCINNYCGGVCTQNCPDGTQCTGGGGCASGYCNNGVCAQQPTNTGGGPGTPTLKDDGEACTLGAECKSLICKNGFCGTTGGTLPDPPVGCTSGSCGSTGDTCTSGSDCSSKVCGTDGKCAAPTCNDGVFNDGEASKDCGSVCGSQKCPDGVQCFTNGDCTSGTCTNIYCGGTCSADCAPGTSCTYNGQCASGECGTDGKCTAVPIPGKNDGEACTLGAECKSLICKNGFCGTTGGTLPDPPVGCTSGSCGSTGDTCTSGSDCSSKVCGTDGKCAAPTCNDGVFNDGEASKDCGSVCGSQKCPDGVQCFTNGDCTSGSCTNNYCGGTCSADCAPGTTCTTNTQCASGECGTDGKCTSTPVTTTPPVPTGKDGDPCAKNADCNNGVCANGFCGTDDGTSGGNPTGCQGTGCEPPGSTCTSAYECSTKVCTSGVCSPSRCDDGIWNGDETGTDCGGSCSTKCANGVQCSTGGDCTSGVCGNGYCNNECTTDCATGGPCKTNGDCASGACNNGICYSPNPGTLPTCNDGIKNGYESDIDCGGPVCLLCSTGKECTDKGDCGAGFSCSSGFCGGVCLANCTVGDPCSSNNVCDSGVCGSDNFCAKASCTDGIQNGAETGVDCGGTCGGCKDGVACKVSGDCTSNDCRNGFCGGVCTQDCPQGEACTIDAQCKDLNCDNKKCEPPKNDNKKQDDSETGIDCGGPEKPCQDGSGCNNGGDCASGICSNGFCGTDDKTPGGDPVGCKGKCLADGAACTNPSDCESKVCGADGTCAVATCTDGVFNGDEGALDCGGTCSTKCLDGFTCQKDGDCKEGDCESGYCGDVCVTNCPKGYACNADTDCASDACENGKCLAPGEKKSGGNPPGVNTVTQPAHCSNGKKDGTESGIDCGGNDCEKLCAIGYGCVGDGDCASGYSCVNGWCGGICKEDCAAGDPCAEDSVCTSLSCGSDHFCKVATCSDGKKNQDETGVDCGGGLCGPCTDGVACTVNGDCGNSSCTNGYCGGVCKEDCPIGYSCTIDAMCADLNCVAGKCSTPSHSNGKMDDSETDVDCGGPSYACENGKGCEDGKNCVSGICASGYCGTKDGKPGGEPIGCTVGCAKTGASCKNPSDCASKNCGADGTCTASSCTDGIFNGDETDTDCGGSCGACRDGFTCQKGGDCTSGTCTTGYCGGICLDDCAPGMKCDNNADCSSEVCSSGSCATASCTDGVRNGKESGVDCGGDCKACANGHACRYNDDCSQNNCKDGYCGGVCLFTCDVGEPCYTDSVCSSGSCGSDNKCVAGTHTDGVKNGDETGVDCGGSAPKKCGYAEGCKDNGDCANANCKDNYCGGICVKDCKVGAACDSNSQCTSKSCEKNTCVAPTNNDGIKNGDETGVDCGGSSGNLCEEGEGCKANTDCEDSDCSKGYCGGVCLDDCPEEAPCKENKVCDSKVCDLTDAKNSTGSCAKATCTDKIQNGDESDVDCGGSCDTACASGKGCSNVKDCETGTACVKGFCGGYKTGSRSDEGAPCTGSSECKSKLCGSDGKCTKASCDDGILNGAEAGIDCGEKCPNKCIEGSPCNTLADCKDALCIAGYCGGVKKPEKSGEDPDLTYTPALQQFEKDEQTSKPTGKATDSSFSAADVGTDHLAEDESSPWSWIVVTLMVLGIIGGSSYLGYNYYMKSHKPVQPMPMGKPRAPLTGKALQQAIAKRRMEQATKARRKQAFRNLIQKRTPPKALPSVPKKGAAPKKADEMDELKEMLLDADAKEMTKSDRKSGKKTKKSSKMKKAGSDTEFVSLEELGGEKEDTKKSSKKKKKGGDDIFDKL